MNTKSALIIGLSLIISCVILSATNFQASKSYMAQGNADRYETTQINSSVWVVTDKQTGECWNRSLFREKEWKGIKLSQ